MSKAAMNLQDSFLNQVRRENADVKVLLVNGTVLRGVVKGFDNFTLILSNRNGQHLVYKHAIAQLVSHRSAADRAEDAEQGTGLSAPERPSQGYDQQHRSRKEAFNRMDLSSVKLGADEEVKLETK
jgi:host factor-I protein